MKKIKIFIMFICLVLLTGCNNKYYGTWCLYEEIASTLIVLNDNVTDSEINNIIKYIDTIPDLKSHDTIDKIDEANKMINVYYNSKDNLDEYENKLKTFSGVKKVENKMLNQAKEKLVITKKDYTYGTNMNSLSAKESKGIYNINNDSITLDNDTTMYYKDKFLCKDKDCNVILTKSKNNVCK